MTCDCRQYDYTRTVDCTAVIFNVTKNSLCDSTFATRSFVLELWRDLLTLNAVAGDLDFSEGNTAHSCLPSSF